MSKQDKDARFAIKFIIENAQYTTADNSMAVYGTLTRDQLENMINALPEGKALFDQAVKKRENPRPRRASCK